MAWPFNKEHSNRLLLNHDQFIERLEKVHGKEYTPLEPYVSMKSDKILVRHNICGYEWKILPDSLLRWQGCFNCNGIPNKTHEIFLSDLKLIHNDEYIALEEYNGAHKKITVKHLPCNYQWKVEPGSLLKGHGCPNCKSSSGEKIIAQYLKEHNLDFKRRVTFEDCKYINVLPFDF